MKKKMTLSNLKVQSFITTKGIRAGGTLDDPPLKTNGPDCDTGICVTDPLPGTNDTCGAWNTEGACPTQVVGCR